MPREKGAPPQITPKSLDDYLEQMTKSAFQSGISWDVIITKWPGFLEAFKKFKIKHVANLTPEDVDELMQDTRVVRNRAKIEATIHNAQAILDLDKEYGGFRKYLRSHADFDALVKDMRKRFKFMGDSGCFHFLYVVKEKVPDWHVWMKPRMEKNAARHKPRSRSGAR
jgi:DNA-3-methyladenine glycosylase I